MTPDVARLVPRAADLIGPGTVVVLAPTDTDLTPLDAAGRVVLPLRHEGGPNALHDALTVLGHVDAVVDVLRGPGVVTRLPVLLQHLRRGGRLVVALPRRAEVRATVTDLLD
ncbi:hypothetical protein, partial [Nocardioides sp.]|uniref:hypothetical protein n=1 Tax=Nocardioides sp. TaxID=35761 RepID=UPI00271E92AA